MKAICYFSLLVLLSSIGCNSSEKNNKSLQTTDSSSYLENNYIKPRVNCRIALVDSVLSSEDTIKVNIQLTNTKKNELKLLFDIPYAPWATKGKVTDLNSKQSVLKHECIASLSSKFYYEFQLKNFYYTLKTGQFLEKQFDLKDIVEFNTTDNSLPPGTYEIQLFYYENPSNIVKLRIQ